MTRSKSLTLNHNHNKESAVDRNKNYQESIMDDQTNVVNMEITRDRYGAINDEYYVAGKDINGNHVDLDVVQVEKPVNFKDSKNITLSDSIEYPRSFNKEANQENNFICSGQKIHSSATDKPPQIKISDIIGDFGKYQIAVVIFAALRAMCCAMDGLSGPFLAPSVKDFECDICSDRISQEFPNFVNTSDCKFTLASRDGQKANYIVDSSQCFFREIEGTDRIPCTKWSFENERNHDYMKSLTVEQSLICDREWLKSLSNSMYFFGTTLGLIFWGIISDRYGRKTAYVCSHFVTLIFGFSALFANSMCTFIILRSINAFGMIGELIPRSIQVEIVEARYRSVCSVFCQIGWATGIILVPNLWSINSNYRFILAFPVGMSIIMLPWLIWLPESARWLMANGNYTRARNEIVRAAIINGKSIEGIDEKIQQLNNQVIQEEYSNDPSSHRIGICKSISAIFTNRRLCKDTFAVFILLFMAEVVYFSLTLNVADLRGSLYLNFVISGFTELLSILFCFVILTYLTRRFCLSLLLVASTISYLLMAVVNVYEDYLPAMIMLSVNAFGKLTAIGNLMVIILISQEIFPTVIRQFGTSLCVTVGKMGSAAAPFTHELGQIIGQSYCFAIFSLLCLLCAIIPYTLLSETGKRELPDTVVDVEKSEEAKANKKHSKQAQSSKGNSTIENGNKHEDQKSGPHDKIVHSSSESDNSSSGDDNSSGFRQYDSNHQLTEIVTDSPKK